MGADPVRQRQSRAHPGQYQSRLPHRRTRIRAQQSRLQGAHSRRTFQDLRLCRHVARAGAGTRSCPTRQARIGAPTGAALDRSPWRQLASRHLPLLRNHDAWRCGRSQAHRRIGAAVAIRRADQHSVHLRHHRLPKGRDPVAPQHPQQWFLHRRSHAAHARGPAVHPGAALSLFWHGARQSGGADARRLHDLSSLRTGIMAGSPCPIEVMKRAVGNMHLSEITIAYGMTETSPVSFQSSTEDPLERRVSTVGRIQPHVEVKIVDLNGRIVPTGTPGELLTRGYCVMLGYWGDEERTREAIDAARWMHTGDLATIDAEGYCNIVGRIKDMVIRGGENVYPREIEEFLYRHPKIQDVQVIGVPDDRYSEEICAWVKLRPGVSATEEEIRAFCRDQIAHYKVPRYIKFVDEFPMTVTGKIQKFIMRERTIAELGLKVQKT